MRPILAVTAGLLVTALVAAGVTLAILRVQSRTNTQQVNLRNGVTITEDSAIIAAATKARPAVVSIVTQHQPSLVRGSGYLATSDGYIVTNINVIDGGTSGGPLVNVGSQVVGVSMESTSAVSGVGLNVADIQDDVQQILQTGQVVVSSLGATTADVTSDSAVLSGVPEGSRLVALDKGGPAATGGLKVGDVITQLDDVKLDAAHPLSLLLRSRFHANQRVTVTYSRDGVSTQAELTLTSQHPTCA